jgi:hypothetical protein
MDPLQTLGFALGTSFASGLNLYATIAAAGVFHRTGLITLPPGLSVLGDPIVLGIATVLFLVEFVADKIPLVDSLWDTLHTFIRPPAAAMLAYGAFTTVPEAWKLAAALLAGGVALSSHSAKATTRAAVNTSPEPISNWFLSFIEDGIAVFLVWFAAEHPVIAGATVVVLVVLSAILVWKLARFVQRMWRRVRGLPPEMNTGAGAVTPPA